MIEEGGTAPKEITADHTKTKSHIPNKHQRLTVVRATLAGRLEDGPLLCLRLALLLGRTLLLQLDELLVRRRHHVLLQHLHPLLPARQHVRIAVLVVEQKRHAGECGSDVHLQSGLGGHEVHVVVALLEGAVADLACL